MKPGSKVPGIIVFCSGIVLCVVSEFLLGAVLMIAGIGMIFIQPVSNESQKQTTPKKSTQKTTPPKTPVKKAAAPVSGAPAADCYEYSGTAAEYFDHLLRNCFSGYTMRRDVSVQAMTNAAPAKTAWKCSCGARNTGKFCAECGLPMPVVKDWTCGCGAKNSGKFCTECGTPRPAVSAPVSNDGPVVTFALFKDGAPKCAIILTRKKDWDSEAVTNAMNACAKAGIPCLRFMEEFRNEAGYVVDRINGALR